MGCWGITAFESDTGLDAIEFIREKLPVGGKVELDKMLENLRGDSWNAPPDVESAGAHTSVMALAELMIKFADGDMGSLDYEDEWAKEERKFSSITSFAASRETVLWIRNYMFDTLRHIKEEAGAQTEDGKKWGGWFEEKNWIGWQEHMAELVSRLDTLLESSEAEIELISLQRQKYQEMKNIREMELSSQNKPGM